jgi:hypothetical protein
MKAVPAHRASPQPGHVRFCRRFVEEDESVGGEATLPASPDPASPGDIGAGLFVGAERLFLYVMPMSEST